jgi:hypothetical protein
MPVLMEPREKRVNRSDVSVTAPRRKTGFPHFQDELFQQSLIDLNAVTVIHSPRLLDTDSLWCQVSDKPGFFDEERKELIHAASFRVIHSSEVPAKQKNELSIEPSGFGAGYRT